MNPTDQNWHLHLAQLQDCASETWEAAIKANLAYHREMLREPGFSEHFYREEQKLIKVLEYWEKDHDLSPDISVDLAIECWINGRFHLDWDEEQFVGEVERMTDDILDGTWPYETDEA